jgi:hypothetical protein
VVLTDGLGGIGVFNTLATFLPDFYFFFKKCHELLLLVAKVWLFLECSLILSAFSGLTMCIISLFSKKTFFLFAYFTNRNQ